MGPHENKELSLSDITKYAAEAISIATAVLTELKNISALLAQFGVVMAKKEEHAEPASKAEQEQISGK